MIAHVRIGFDLAHQRLSLLYYCIFTFCDFWSHGTVNQLRLALCWDHPVNTQLSTSPTGQPHISGVNPWLSCIAFPNIFTSAVLYLFCICFFSDVINFKLQYSFLSIQMVGPTFKWKQFFFSYLNWLIVSHELCLHVLVWEPTLALSQRSTRCNHITHGNFFSQPGTCGLYKLKQ